MCVQSSVYFPWDIMYQWNKNNNFYKNWGNIFKIMNFWLITLDKQTLFSPKESNINPEMRKATYDPTLLSDILPLRNFFVLTFCWNRKPIKDV